jgi:hypothetical protein
MAFGVFGDANHFLLPFKTALRRATTAPCHSKWG